MFLARIDNRLIHGQIIETWLPYTGASTLVVANDELSSDVLQQEIMALAIPGGVEANFTPVEEVAADMAAYQPPYDNSDTIILFSTCADALRAYKAGLAFATLNLGNLHYSPGKKQICPHVALSQEDEEILSYFLSQGVKLDFRCVPTEAVQVRQTW